MGPVSSWAGGQGPAQTPCASLLVSGFLCSPIPRPDPSPLPSACQGVPREGPSSPLGVAEAALSLMMWGWREAAPEMELLPELSGLFRANEPRPSEMLGRGPWSRLGFCRGWRPGQGERPGGLRRGEGALGL